jgi:hypothetical protein
VTPPRRTGRPRPDASHVRLVGQYTVELRTVTKVRAVGGAYQWHVPRLTIAGRALEAAGFPPGAVVVVTSPRPGALVVQRVTLPGVGGAAPIRPLARS